MWVYHVCGKSKFDLYLKIGGILPKVRAWIDIKEAERFSKQTGRPIILRLKFPNNATKLGGHKNKVVFVDYKYELPKEIMRKCEV
jgi:hypothetical protein